MYKVLNENNEPPSGKISWNKKYNLDANGWKKIYVEPLIITKDRQFSGSKPESTIKS